MTPKDGSRPILLYNKKFNSLAIVVRSAKTKNYVENIKYYFFIDGEQLFFYGGEALIAYYFCINIFIPF